MPRITTALLLLLPLLATAAPEAAAPAGRPALRIGLVADVQYADKDSEIGRHYRDSLGKLREAVARFNEEKADLLIELGDLVDAGDTVAEETAYLKAVEAELVKFRGDGHYVLGNHCLWSLTRDEYRKVCAGRGEHYSFDKGGFHFVILDACYRPDGATYGAKNSRWQESLIPEAERRWLAADLAATAKKTLVFVHQRLDAGPPYGVQNAAEVRKTLEDSGKVLAVFQGHHHAGDLQKVNGIHYVTLVGMTEGAGAESNAYGVLDVFGDGTLVLTGFRRQKSLVLPAGAR